MTTKVDPTVEKWVTVDTGYVVSKTGEFIHPVQVDIYKFAKEQAKNHRYLANMTLREIGKAVGIKDPKPQSIKHHVGRLVKMGLLKTTKIGEI